MEGLGVPKQSDSGISHPSPTLLLSALYGAVIGEAECHARETWKFFLKKGKSSEKRTEGKKKISV